MVHPGVMTPEQSRAARGWLEWSRGELAKQAHVSLRTVASFERGEKMPLHNNIAAMRAAIEAEGSNLLFDDAGAAAGIVRRGTRINLGT